MTATAEQTLIWQEHKDICQQLGIGQSTLQHRSLMGTLSAASATGVKTYTGPNPSTTAPTTTDTLVWAVWQQQLVRSSDDPVTGRQGMQRMICQIPAVDDSGNVVTVSHDDSLKDANGTTYRILNPTIQPDLGFWSFEALKRR